jgi:hypothetical protein
VHRGILAALMLSPAWCAMADDPKLDVRDAGGRL